MTFEAKPALFIGGEVDDLRTPNRVDDRPNASPESRTSATAREEVARTMMNINST